MTQKKVIAIIANGEVLNPAIINEVISRASLVIAADGGALTCRNAGIVPNFIIGDCDSLNQELRDYFNNVEIIKLDDQYSTDMEKALEFAKSFSPEKLLIFSAFGKRMDHTVANLLFLAEINEIIPVEIYDNYGIMQIFNPGQHVINSNHGQLVSFFAVKQIKNLSLQGFRYSLTDQDFDSYFVGISNICDSEFCKVEFDSGILFIYKVSDKG